MVNLPIDIFTHIIASIITSNKSRRSDLFALSLTCRALVPLCQLHIFNSVKFIDPRGRSFRLKVLFRFNLILERSPHLGSYVRELRIALDEEDGFFIARFLSKVLEKLDRIESLHIEGAGWVLIDWLALGEGVTEPFRRMFGSQSLKKLSFGMFHNVPLSVFSRLSGGLKHLSITDIDIITDAEENANPGNIEQQRRSAAEMPRLRSLEFGSNHELSVSLMEKLVGNPGINTPTAPLIVNFSELHDLSIQWNFIIDTFYAQHLLRSAPSLEILRCHSRGEGHLIGGRLHRFCGLAKIISPPSYLHLPSPGIKMIQLISPALHLALPTLLDDLQSASTQCSSSNIVEHIILTFMSLASTSRVIDLIPSNLSDLLVPLFPHLRKLSLEFLVSPPWADNFPGEILQTELEEQIIEDLGIGKVLGRGLETERLQWMVKVRIVN